MMEHSKMVFFSNRNSNVKGMLVQYRADYCLFIIWKLVQRFFEYFREFY